MDQKRQRALERKKAYEDGLKPFPILLKAKKSVGRYLVASRTIKAGEVILSERPVAAILFQQYCQTHCGTCFNRLAKESIMCSGCKSQCFWCNQECKEKDNRHEFVCQLFKKIAGIAGSSGVDDALIRCMALVFAQLHIGSVPLDVLMASKQQVNQMVAHPYMVTEKWTDAITAAAQDMISEFSESMSSVSVNDITQLAMQINANSFAVFDPNRKVDGAIGVGVYPFAALCNHSCIPNVHYTTSKVDGCINFVAVRDIEEGEQIYDTYTGLILLIFRYLCLIFSKTGEINID